MELILCVFSYILIAPFAFLSNNFQCPIRNIFFFFLWTVLRDPIACSILGGGIPTQNSGYNSTRLCSSKFSFLILHHPSLPCFRPVVYLGWSLIRPAPFCSTRPALSLRLILSSRVPVRFHVHLLLRIRLQSLCCLRQPFLCPLQVYSVLFPPPPWHPRSWPTSVPLT